jgi:putative ABC transport system permease protein
MRAIDHMLWRDLLHLRGQAIAVALVVACGIATWVTMRATYDSLRLTQEAYYREYRFADVFAGLERAPVSLEREIAAIPGVATVETRVVAEVTLDVPGLDEPATGRIVSIPAASRPALCDLYLRRGAWVEPGRRDEAIVSEAFATANGLAVGDTIGAVINGRWERLRIVGVALSPEYVYEVRGGAAFFPDNRRFGVLWMEREPLAAAFDLEGAFNDVVIALAPGASRADVVAALDRLLAPYGGLGAYDRDEQVSHRFLSDEIAQQRVTGLYVPAIFLTVAAFLIYVVLARLVGMQRDQIAALKAFGYTNGQVGRHYVKLALAIVAAGAAGGIALGLWLGWALTRVYTDFYRFPILRFEWGLETVGLATAISAAAGALGAFAAVRGAVRLPPAEAMRPEPPARFRPLVVERLGWHHLLSTTTRMIARNLERRPVKSALSVLGIALSAAIVLVGLFFFDTFDYLLATQFQVAQREDVMVAFSEPRPPRAKLDLGHMAGVLDVEPYRVVPARLRAGHRSKRAAVLGLEPGAELRRLVGADLTPVELPEEGVVLTEKLAELLGVAPGDTIAVEVLEGGRRAREVAVAATVDEMLGTSAYMRLDALARLTGDGEAISGAFLLVDDAREADLYAELKRTPAVGGVSIREVVIASMEETIRQSFTISTTALALFAAVIAVGVVYNSARVALSERGRELASLRVLGFTQGEVSVMLLGEQAILTALAIPVGLALGYAICALLSARLDTELYRLPLVIAPSSYAVAALVVMGAALVSGLLVRRRLRHLDMVAVLKTRE